MSRKIINVEERVGIIREMLEKSEDFFIVGKLKQDTYQVYSSCNTAEDRLLLLQPVLEVMMAQFEDDILN